MNTSPPLPKLAVEIYCRRRFSLDAHLSEAVPDGPVIFVRVTNDDHPRVNAGDLLIIEDGVEGEDKDLLLLEVNGKPILRQKKFVKALLRQAHIHLVGSDETSRSVRIIGRVVGWLKSPP